MDHFAHNTSVDGLTGQSSMGNPAAFNSDRIEPHSESEPNRKQHLSDPTKDAVVETPDNKLTQTPSSVRLISEQRVRDEKLEWLKPTIAGDNVSYLPADDKDLYGGHGKIVDAQGVVYDGILCEGGTVDEGWFGYDSPQTFEYFSRSKDEYNSLPKNASPEPSSTWPRRV